MRYAALVQLASMAGYKVTMTCDPYGGGSLLTRGETTLTFSTVRDMANYLVGQVEMMAELADSLG
jgi:hypothetical protein